MRHYAIFLFILSVICLSCGKEKVELEAFSAETFAYDTGAGWEVNASARVKGLEQVEENEFFVVRLSYSLDLIKPDGETVKDVYSDMQKMSKNEEFIDVPIEGQFNLDSTYTEGKYKVAFNVTDEATRKSVTLSAEFEIAR